MHTSLQVACALPRLHDSGSICRHGCASAHMWVGANSREMLRKSCASPGNPWDMRKHCLVSDSWISLKSLLQCLKAMSALGDHCRSSHPRTTLASNGNETVLTDLDGSLAEPGEGGLSCRVS